MRTITRNATFGLTTADRLAKADLDVYGAAQFELALSLLRDDGTSDRYVLDTEKATRLGQALIGEAAIAEQRSQAEIDRYWRRCGDRRGQRVETDNDDLPF